MKPYSVTPILLLVALALSACSPSKEAPGPASIEVSDAWVRAPGAMAGMNMGSPGALYMLIGNHGDSTDTLLKVERSGAPRGDERWGWLCFALVNAGIILIVANSIAGVQALGFGARGLELLGFTAFAIGNWGRLKPLMT